MHQAEGAGLPVYGEPRMPLAAGASFSLPPRTSRGMTWLEVVSRSYAPYSGELKLTVIICYQRPKAGLTKPHRFFEHCSEHRGEVAKRGADILQDRGGPGLPFERRRQLCLEGIDPRLHLGVGGM